MRYTLVATTEENAVIHGQYYPKNTSHLALVNMNDRHVTASLLTKRLSSIHQQNSFSALHAAFMILQFADFLRVNGDYKLGISIMEASVRSFFREFV